MKSVFPFSMRWTQIEDIFLTGVVLDAYYRRHSLKPSIEEKRLAKEKGLGEDSVVWSKIHSKYKLVCDRHCIITGEQLPTRTAGALQKHWKETGRKRKVEVIDSSGMPLTKQYERIWDNEYNDILLGSEESFLCYLENRMAKTISLM